MQDDIFRGNTCLQGSFHTDATYFQRIHNQGLACQNITNLTRANSERNTTKGPMGRRVRITAADGHAWLGQSKFGPYHMNDALGAGFRCKELDTVLLGRRA